MQSVGFCFTMIPLLGRLGEDKDGRREFLERHLRFFNTNPVLAGYAIGAAGALEVRGADGSEVDSVKRGLASPLGMSGDALMWGALRPFAGLVAVVFALGGSLWAPLAMVAIYGLPAVILRARGIEVGSSRGPSGSKEVLGRSLKSAVRGLRAGVAFGVGLIVAMAVRGSGGVELWKLAAAAAFLLLAWAGARARVPATVIGVAGATAGLLLVAAGLNGGGM
jgi:mannose/fructose/N-acetylgalactosamine-specific phosphotransferase system component IID